MKFLNVVTFLPVASAHFLLKYPTTVGFDDDKEGESPCGSFTNFTGGAMTSVQVGGFPIQLQSEHPEADWDFRAMLGTNGTNWTTLMPIVHQVGLGDFCIPDFKAPDEWAGKSGLLQIIQNAADGTLYQCAVVMYMSGTNSSTNGCTNASMVTATALTASSFASASPTGSSMSSSGLAPKATGGILAVGGAVLMGAAALL